MDCSDLPIGNLLLYEYIWSEVDTNIYSHGPTSIQQSLAADVPKYIPYIRIVYSVYGRASNPSALVSSPTIQKSELEQICQTFPAMSRRIGKVIHYS